MDILFEDSNPGLAMWYDSLKAEQSIMLEMVQTVYYYEKTGDVEILTEGVMDVIKHIIYEIVAMIVKIKDTIKSFFTRMNSQSMEYGKLMDKYAQILHRREDIKPFDVEGFNFIISKDNCPDMYAADSIYTKYNAQLMAFNLYTSDKIRALIEDIKQGNKNFELRGKLLGISGGIKKEDLKSTAFMHYRDGQTETVKIKVDKKMVREIIANAMSVSAAKKWAITSQKETDKLLKDMEHFFKDVVPAKLKETQRAQDLSYGGRNGGLEDIDYKDTKVANVNDFMAYVNAMYHVTVEMANDVTVVFTEYISAITSKMNQDIYIVKKALMGSGIDVTEEFAIFDKYNSYPSTPNLNWAKVMEGCNTLGGDR